MLKAAVIGVGYLGQYHAEKYFRSKLSELAAVVDLDSSRAKKIARRFKAQAISDFRELPLLGVKCASVAAVTTAHFEIARWLLQNGIDVLVEKPITVTQEQARELIDVAREEGRILQVGHLERFNPAFVAMKEVLTQPRFFEVRRIAQFSGRSPDVDVVLDLMIHDIDIIAHLVGRPLLRVEAVGVPVLTKSVDIANARLTFEGGAVANVTASRAAYKSERTVRIFQPDVYISLDYGNKKLKIYSRRAGAEHSEGGLPKIDIKEYKVEERDALNDEIESFLNCVQTRSEPEVTGEDGLRALELAARIHQGFQESLSLIDSEEGLLDQFAGLKR